MQNDCVVEIFCSDFKKVQFMPKHYKQYSLRYEAHKPSIFSH